MRVIVAVLALASVLWVPAPASGDASAARFADAEASAEGVFASVTIYDGPVLSLDGSTDRHEACVSVYSEFTADTYRRSNGCAPVEARVDDRLRSAHGSGVVPITSAVCQSPSNTCVTDGSSSSVAFALDWVADDAQRGACSSMGYESPTVAKALVLTVTGTIATPANGAMEVAQWGCVGVEVAAVH